MKIVVAGGAGFVGGALVRRFLEAKDETVVLSRSGAVPKGLAVENLKIEKWDARTGGAWESCVNGADAVVNLAGESIAAKRWDRDQKNKILGSRLDATRAIVGAIQKAGKRPKVLVNASAVGFYGDVRDQKVDESFPKGKGFLADTCQAWENEAKKAEAFGVRVVLLRFGVVLEKNGGALGKFIFPFQIFAGGPLGSGSQPFPWVHRGDVVGSILHSIRQDSLSGPVNVVSPETATMKEFCSALGRTMHRPSWLPVPAFALKALLGEMAEEMLLSGAAAVPAKLEASGYRFRHPKLQEALMNIFRKSA
jgi:hypothetical protein